MYSFKKYFHKFDLSGTCGNCVDWKAEAAEIRDGEIAYRLETATWSPVLGFVIKDSLFPHVSGGLRGRDVMITSIQVHFTDELELSNNQGLT